MHVPGLTRWAQSLAARYNFCDDKRHYHGTNSFHAIWNRSVQNALTVVIHIVGAAVYSTGCILHMHQLVAKLFE